MSAQRKSTAFAPRAQLSILEHALCPLDSRVSLKPAFAYRTNFNFTDQHRNRKLATVDIGAVHGIAAPDEFYLWGLLGLALSQSDPSPDFQATPFWCLKQLGLVTDNKSGGEEFRLFRESLRRIAGVRYYCDQFFDPILREHREVSFGFLSYSLPHSAKAGRTWRFSWDPIFWDFCSANAGCLRFDLSKYRELSPAARRLYLFLKKVFWRNDFSPKLELRSLAINVLGFSASLPTKEIRRKVLSCANELLERRIVRTNDRSISDSIVRKSKGVFMIQFHRGEEFNSVSRPCSLGLDDSPLFEPLHALGFDRGSMSRIIQDYSAKLIQLWAEITHVAMEQGRIKETPQAYFTYYLNRASAGLSTPPDWWREFDHARRSEESKQRREREQLIDSEGREAAFREYCETEARESFLSVMNRLRDDLISAGKLDRDAEMIAREHTERHFRNRFRQESTTSIVKNH